MSDTLTDKTRLDDEWPYSPKFHKFADFLGVPSTKDSKGIYWRGDSKLAKKMEELWMWAKERIGSDEPIDIMYAVNQLRKDLGVSWKGKTLIEHLWGWTQLDTKKIAIEKDKELIDKEMEIYKEPAKEENVD